MKRNIAIAAVTAAVLIGGAAATTVAFADDDSDRTGRSTGSGTAPKTITTDGDDDTVRTVTGTTTISLDEAVAAALKSVPGTVTEAELDDDDEDRDVWELDVYGSDKVWHDVTVDARNGTVLTDREDDDNDDRDRYAPKSASLSLDAAVKSALRTAPGSVTSVDLDNDDDDDGRRGHVLRWDIDIAGKDGRHHELHVDAKTGKVTVDRDDDSDDDHGDDRDDRDDRGDDGDDR
ncbi:MULTISPECIES: PepSY domain-containing protein [unclassified Streptomyces]|uniref:PepSY domain-containing protein n=1 Tax=unclassified Streptomyces TaxID=2593676 RepID=UPI000939A74B|nr:PepSY domain-containing protein [Streptomyces sp. TSRI0281]OKI34353.1 peptidase M4 [Streptomyces sp. TSRI0281]